MKHEYKISSLINTLLDVIVDHGDIPLTDKIKMELEICEDGDKKYAVIKQKNQNLS